MFYSTADHHGLKHNPFKALIVPRPIGWISSISADGHVNLAPYSFFNAVADSPPVVLFAPNGEHTDGGYKDTYKNILETHEFVCNLVTWELRDSMNISSGDVSRETNEFELSDLEYEPSELVKPPRVKRSLAHFECRYLQTVQLPANTPGTTNNVVFGEVIGIHINDSIIEDGMINMQAFKPIARLGYFDYTTVDNIFSMRRPT
jgi:flavin reductase (DIM6/NTAB) family NADH-FMN oxidoreductase RutF